MLLSHRNDLKMLLANINEQKDLLKKKGLTVDGKHFKVSFKSKTHNKPGFFFYTMFFTDPIKTFHFECHGDPACPPKCFIATELWVTRL